MPLKITYKSPPYRDKVLSFPDTLEEIRIGRTAGSEVEYPEDMASVGHDHFAIVRQARAPTNSSSILTIAFMPAARM